MEKAKKITKRENFTEIKNILEGLNREDLVAVMDNELAILDRKRSAVSKTQTENIELMERVLEVLKTDFTEPATVIDIYDKVRDDEKIKSTQKVVYLLKQLVGQNKVVEVKDKKKTLYSANKEI